jgi:hypothetical protein
LKTDLMTGTTQPRRERPDLLTPAELAIRDAVLTIDKIGRGIGREPLLEEAIALLIQARMKVSDFVDRDQERSLHKIYEGLSELLPQDDKWHTFTVRCRRDGGVPLFYCPSFVAGASPFGGAAESVSVVGP